MDFVHIPSLVKYFSTRFLPQSQRNFTLFPPHQGWRGEGIKIVIRPWEYVPKSNLLVVYVGFSSLGGDVNDDANVPLILLQRNL